MPKLRVSEQERKDQLFRALIAKNMEMYGIDSKRELARCLNVSEPTIYKKLKSPDQFTRLELRTIFTLLKFTPEEKAGVV